MKKKTSGLLIAALVALILLLQQSGLLPTPEKTSQDTPRGVTQGASTAPQAISRDGHYTDRDSVALYLNTYGELPENFLTKAEADKLGFDNHRVTLDMCAPGMSIGGSHFGNYEGSLPDAKGRNWKECDIGYVKGVRSAKRIVYSSDGLIYYTSDHYKTFERLY